jgi:hypothetical protein
MTQKIHLNKVLFSFYFKKWLHCYIIKIGTWNGMVENEQHFNIMEVFNFLIRFYQSLSSVLSRCVIIIYHKGYCLTHMELYN